MHTSLLISLKNRIEYTDYRQVKKIVIGSEPQVEQGKVSVC